MPSTRIETTAGWLDGRQQQLIAAVQSALVEGIRIPEVDRCIRLIEYSDQNIANHPGAGPHYTIIEIAMFSGRSIDVKRRLYAALAQALEPFGVPAKDLKIILHDVPRENWSVGGVALSDVDIGFKIDV